MKTFAFHRYLSIFIFSSKININLNFKSCKMSFYLLFWYQVFTCVSVRLRRAASSMRSCTLRYFCRSKLLSRELSWWSVNAVRALRGFFAFNEPSGPPSIPEVKKVTMVIALQIQHLILIIMHIVFFLTPEGSHYVRWEHLIHAERVYGLYPCQTQNILPLKMNLAFIPIHLPDMG